MQDMLHNGFVCQHPRNVLAKFYKNPINPHSTCTLQIQLNDSLPFSGLSVAGHL